MLTLIVGLMAGSLGFDSPSNSEAFKKVELLEETVISSGASGSCYGKPDKASRRPENPPAADAQGLKIFAKPRAVYTDEARRNLTSGAVVLRVTFLASGEIGAVTPVTELPDGLTGQAVAAARAIRFEPAKRNGQNISVTKTVEYQFTIY